MLTLVPVFCFVCETITRGKIMDKVMHNEAVRRFELALSGTTAYIDYKVKDDGSLAFTHTFVPVELQGQGVAARLTEGALRWCREAGKQVLPLCSYTVVYFKRHPEWNDLKRE